MTVGRQLGQNDQAIGSRCKGVLCFLGKTGNYFILLTAFQGLFQSTKIGMRGGSEEQYFPAAVKHLYEYGRSVILFSDLAFDWRSEEHTSELQSLMRISYAVFCLKKKK